MAGPSMSQPLTPRSSLRRTKSDVESALDAPHQNWSRALGGWLLVGATAVMATGAAIPFFAPSLSDAPWSDVWDELARGIAGNPVAWRWANALFLATAVVTAFGLAALSQSFSGRAHVMGMIGVTAFGFAAVVSVIDRAISIGVAPWAAAEGLSSTDPTVQAFILMDQNLSLLFFVLGFASVILFGMAIAFEGRRDARSGWVVAGAGILGIAIALTGFAIPAFVYMTTAAIGVLALWRQVGA